MIKNKNILITLLRADGLHGSVVYTAELGKYLNACGFNVYCATIDITDEIRRMFSECGIAFYRIDKLPMDVHYDLIWAHHFPLLPYLIARGLKYDRIINSSLSNILPVEKPIFFLENIDLILTLTDKTKRMFKIKYGCDKNKIIVLPNVAPDEFFDVNVDLPASVRHIAVVSNHPPHEIQKLRHTIPHVSVEYFGLRNNNSVAITPALLSKFDVIISIGKTVQYAMAMGIPVYNYDHFGGSGYITPENIDIEEASNFSGRSFFTKKQHQKLWPRL